MFIKPQKNKLPINPQKRRMQLSENKHKTVKKKNGFAPTNPQNKTKKKMLIKLKNINVF